MLELGSIYKKHDSYSAAIQRTIAYMSIVNGDIDDDPPPRSAIVQSLALVLAHLVNRRDCVACSASHGLQEIELAFLAAFEVFSARNEYRRWWKAKELAICCADGEDEGTVIDPFYCAATFLNIKRLDGVVASMFITAETIDREKKVGKAIPKRGKADVRN